MKLLRKIFKISTIIYIIMLLIIVLIGIIIGVFYGFETKAPKIFEYLIFVPIIFLSIFGIIAYGKDLILWIKEIID
jgi:cation transporter-like permease